jgi:hypothetical protein
MTDIDRLAIHADMLALRQDFAELCANIPSEIPMSDPADRLLWCEQQVEPLRRRAVEDLDFDNLAEEIADVGRAELLNCKKFLRQALRHMLKAQAWPQSARRADLASRCDRFPPGGAGRRGAADRTMKIKVWVLSTCIPGETKPSFPEVCGTEEAAEALADEKLREKWEAAGQYDDEYPDDWRAAQEALIDYCRLEITSHVIDVPSETDLILADIARQIATLQREVRELKQPGLEKAP